MKPSAVSPAKLIEMSGAYWQSCALHAAVELDVFTVLADEVLSAEALSSRLKTDVRGLSVLANALCAMGLLTRNQDGYQNTETARTLLSRDASGYIGFIILHHHHLVESWARLDQAVQTGKPVRTRSSHGDAVQRESFLMGMFNIAMHTAPGIVSQIDLAGRKNLLDLGGGPGTYAIHFCLANPDLLATVYDLPTTRPFALKTIEGFGLSGRIGFEAGDFLNDPIPGAYDVAWLSQILHGEGPADCEKIVEKAVSVLRPGGMILIHEFILDDTLDRPLHSALFSLNMLLATDQGRSYSDRQIRNMLVRCGIRGIQRMHLKGPSGILYGFAA